MAGGTFDIIVVGLGAMGSAAVAQLAQRRTSVLGLDRFHPPHELGSSHGQTRIIREAYFEHPAYVPLVQRAYELWADLEQRDGRKLWLKTGGLMVGPPGSTVFQGAKASAEQHQLRHEILTSRAVHEQFPALRPDDDMAAVWEPRAGILFPETCIDAQLQQARAAGAQLHLGERVITWSPEGAGFRVTTETAHYLAGQVLFTAGAWTSRLLADLRLPLRIERQVLHWFAPASTPALFQPDACPIYLWEFDSGQHFYGFPNLGEGVKVARHHRGTTTDPDAVDRAIHPEEVEDMRGILRRFLPAANGLHRSSVVCMYTNTPDGHFLIDRHPRWPQLLIASPCSGHGFKFASAIGEVAADLLLAGASPFDLRLFRIERLLRT